MPKDNLPEPQSEIAKILNATLKGEDLNSLPATCEISQYQKEMGKKYQEIIDGGGGGTPVSLEWGNITGTLSNQEDLQSAISSAETKAAFSEITGTPQDNVNLKESLDDINESINKKAEIQYYTATIPVDNWSETAPYFQTIPVTGIAEADNPIVDVILNSTVDVAKIQAESWNYISKISVANNSITPLCLEKKPEVDLEIQIAVVK